MFAWEVIRLKARGLYIDATKNVRRKGLINGDFTIISNNCWAGLIYQSYGLSYRTPTIGLFFPAKDYIQFVYDLDCYLNMSLQFIKPEDSKWFDKMKDKSNWGTYPIGILDDVEIHFLHYKDADEAFEKWERRKTRINFNKLILKFNDQNFCTKEDLIAWSQLKRKNKLCFTCRQHPDISGLIYINSARKQTEIKASYEPFGNSRAIDMTDYLNHVKKENEEYKLIIGGRH